MVLLNLLLPSLATISILRNVRRLPNANKIIDARVRTMLPKNVRFIIYVIYEYVKNNTEISLKIHNTEKNCSHVAKRENKL